MSGRPRIAIGTYGSIRVARLVRGRHTAHTRYRDVDGVLREVKATSSTPNRAIADLKTRLVTRHGYGHGGMLSLTNTFGDLVELWLADLERREISAGTKKNYRDDVRVHVRPFFDNYTLGEITTGRVETFLKAERAVSYSRATHSRTMLNLLFGFALRHDAIARNPVECTSPLRTPKGSPEALTLDQIQRIREAAAVWRTGPGVKGPKPVGTVRDVLEVLLGTGLRPGEALALRPVDIADGRKGMVAHVSGTVVYRQGSGTFRQAHPKTDASVRTIPVPDFAACVIRRRLKEMDPAQSEWTIFHNRTGTVRPSNSNQPRSRGALGTVGTPATVPPGPRHRRGPRDQRRAPREAGRGLCQQRTSSIDGGSQLESRQGPPQFEIETREDTSGQEWSQADSRPQKLQCRISSLGRRTARSRDQIPARFWNHRRGADTNWHD